MPNLKYFTIYGNTTVYQWRTGIAPNKIEKTPIQYDFGGDEVKPTEEETTIDFGFNDEDVLVEVVNIFFHTIILPTIKILPPLIHYRKKNPQN